MTHGATGVIFDTYSDVGEERETTSCLAAFPADSRSWFAPRQIRRDTRNLVHSRYSVAAIPVRKKFPREIANFPVLSW